MYRGVCVCGRGSGGGGGVQQLILNNFVYVGVVLETTCAQRSVCVCVGSGRGAAINLE